MNKASGGDGIPVSGFQILKDDAVKVLHLICQQIWKTGLEKVSFHSNSKECSNYCTTALMSHTSKLMLKILQARLQQYVNHELPDVKLIQKRQRNQRSNCQHPFNHLKSKRVPEKISTSVLLTMSKPLTVWITTNCGKFFKRWEYQTT